MKRMKRTVSWLLILSLLLGLFTFPGFAEEENSGNGSTDSSESTPGGNSGEESDGTPGDDGEEDNGGSTPTPVPAEYICTFNMTQPKVIDPAGTAGYSSGVRVVKKVEGQPDEVVNSSNITETWVVSQGQEIVTVDAAGTVTGRSPGVAEVTVTVSVTEDGKTVEVGSSSQTVTVSGIVLSKSVMELLEAERADLPVYTLYGAAQGKTVTWSSSNTAVANTSRDIYVDAWSVGTAQLTAKVADSNYSAQVSVTVKINEADAITFTLTPGGNLLFADIESQMKSLCQSMTGSTLSHITGLSVSPTQGILFVNYKSEEEPGAGVAQSANYYTSSATKGPYIQDITFVPSAYYTGESITIQYGGVSADKRSFTGRILVTLPQTSNDLSLVATATSPARFTSQMFSEVCQRATSSALDRVTFSLPADTRGMLYYDYVSDIDYDSKIELGKEYSLSKLDHISFVPSPGYTGTVNIYYTGYTISNRRYTGQIHVTVTQSTEGGPVYNIGHGGVAVFNESDFRNYCYAVTGRSLNRVKFKLPDSEQGVLYYDYSNNSSMGTRVSGTTTYYPNRTPRIYRIAFVPDEEFSGTVEIPFTGWDEDNTSFDGIVEINVRSTGTGDVTYTCYPGSYVKFNWDDFQQLCRSVTHDTLDYITFQTLPNSSDGVLYTYKSSSGSSGTRVTRGTRYYYNNVSNMSFWADDDFRGSIELTFTGESDYGDSFNGVLKITAREFMGDQISYTAENGKPVTFDDEDFNDLCWDLTNAQLNYVRFTLPDEDDGTLYYDYRNSYSNEVSSTRSYYYSGYPYLSKVSFLPKKNFSGLLKIPFKAYADNSENFEGYVEVYVQAGAFSGDVTYTTSYAPITFKVEDFEGMNRENSEISSVEFGKLPDSDEGCLYYQYSGPNQYSWKASTGTQYKVNGSPRLDSLTFVPRANFTGRIILPYTATRVNGSKYSGEVVIYVENSGYSNHFKDMNGYSSQARAAVDYLYESGIVSGVGNSCYGPSNSIRRGDFALMLYKAFHFYSPGKVETFRDVPEDAYYAKAVHTLRGLGIVSGLGNNMYSPDSMLTRQDAMIMVQKALQVAGWSTRSADENILYDYNDNSQVSGYARQAMAYVMKWDLLPITGYRLDPTAELTRVDMAQVLHRALTY